MDIIVDIDGTIADMRHRRHFVEFKDKNWPAFFKAMDKDKPIKPVIKTINALRDKNNRLIFCTGRPNEYRNITFQWLSDNGVYYSSDTDLLMMRRDGDYRPDYEAKEDMLMSLNQLGIKPYLAFEDKQECVDMWRRHGIITLQNSMREMP